MSVSAENSHGQLQIPCARNSSISVYGCNEIGCSPNSTSAIPQFKGQLNLTLLVKHESTNDLVSCLNQINLAAIRYRMLVQIY